VRGKEGGERARSRLGDLFGEPASGCPNLQHGATVLDAWH
jgi:hypothetical protein